MAGREDDQPVRVLLQGWIALTVAIAVAVAVLPGIDVDGGVLTYLWIAALFAFVNLLLGPILRLLSAPLILITLGLFALVINALLFAITAWLSSALSVDGFFSALVAAVIVSVVSAVLGAIMDHRRRATAMA